MKSVLVVIVLLFIFHSASAAMLTMDGLREFSNGVSEDAHLEFTTQLLQAYREMFLAIHLDGASAEDPLYKCAMSQNIELVAFAIVWEAKNRSSRFTSDVFNPKQSVAHRYLGFLKGYCADQIAELD